MSAPIARMEAALERMGAEHEPPLGWEIRVLAEVRVRPLQSRWWVALFSLAAIALIAWPRPEPSNHNLSLDVVRNPAGSAMRGPGAHLGDLVRITATGGDRYRAIWVYRNEHELVAACPEGPACTHSGDTTTADVRLQAIGSYAFVTVTSASPLPAPGDTYDHDLANAREAGATIKTQVIDVR
jgi:hypothetical protein